MGKTISVSSGSVAMRHDRRDYEQGKYPENVNEAMSRYNVYFKTCENEREAFNNFFQDSVNEYNEKQTRADRKKGDYYDEIQKSKNGETPIYEYVFQIGNKDDSHVNSMDGLVCKSILTDYAKGFEKSNPNFHVISSCLHMDEDTPHLHIAFIPYAKGYKKGLETRCSTSKALESMGFEGSERNMKFWKRSQEEKIEELMKERNIEREQYGSTREHMSVQLYKETKDRINSQIEEELEEMTSTLYETADRVTELQNEEFDLVARRDELRREVYSLQDDVLNLTTEKVALENETTRLKGLIARFKAELEQITQWMDKIRTEFSKTGGTLTERMERFMRAIPYGEGTLYDRFKLTELTFAEKMAEAKKESERHKSTLDKFKEQVDRGETSAYNSFGSRSRNDDTDRITESELE